MPIAASDARKKCAGAVARASLFAMLALVFREPVLLQPVRQVAGQHQFRWLIVGLVVLIPLAGVGSCAIHDELLASRFEQITPGMRLPEVEAILGTPRGIEDCAHTEFKPWQRPDCRDAYLYPSWGIPLVPSIWVVWFKADKTVIDKYRFVSW